MALSINIGVLEARCVGRGKLHDLRERQLFLRIEIAPCARHDAYAEAQLVRLHGGERHRAAQPPAVRGDVADGMADHDEVGRCRAERRRRHLRGETETWRASPSPTLAVET